MSSPFRVVMSRKYLDQLKGFAYLETCRELEHWSEDRVDPLQKANTPLHRRPVEASRHDRCQSSNVILVHDYNGGYNDYENCQGAIVPKELYSCSYLQCVDQFVYFTHKLVTIPPSSWTNACHRSGVKVLGTFIVEPGSQDVERILEQDIAGDFWVATALAQIAECYGFDGWLINIETSFPFMAWSAAKLETFLRQLRHTMGSGRKLIWYDALSKLNFVWYQNTLNHLNLSFALAAGSFLSNYAWTPELAYRGKCLAEQSGLGVDNIYFGIDAWAQNVQRDPKHPRVTWPNRGGGGTGTGLGMEALHDLEGPVPGTGIFAPGWSFEHFPYAATTIDQSMWLGRQVPTDYSCDCAPSRPHSNMRYQRKGIARYARHHRLGTACFFHTDFRRAFSIDHKTGHYRAHIAAQAPPIYIDKLWAGSRDEPAYCGHLHVEPRDGCLAVVDLDHDRDSPGYPVRYLPIAQLGIESKMKYQVTVSYRRLVDPAVRTYLKIESKQPLMVGLTSQAEEASTATAVIDLQKGSISGIGLYVDVDDASLLQAYQRVPIVELYSITIQPYLTSSYICNINNITAEQRGPPNMKHLRLCWDISHTTAASNIPFSKLTGPAAFFTLFCNGTEMGRAYALQFVVPAGYAEQWEAAGLSEIQITATGFDGSDLGSSKVALLWPTEHDDEWILVTPP